MVGEGLKPAMRRVEPSVALLLVDDDPVMHKIVETALTRSARCELLIVHAASPRQAMIALDTIPTGPVLVVLADLDMGASVDGFGLLERVAERRSDAIRLLYSGDPATALEKKARDAGVAGVYEKPLDIGAFTRAFWRTAGLAG
jgi:DNA-binding NtrC family response regulator